MDISFMAHRHWYVCYSQAKDDDILNQYVRLWFEDEDGNTMSAEQALKRINATEYFSAEDAELLVSDLELIREPRAMGCGGAEEKLSNYAKILQDQ